MNEDQLKVCAHELAKSLDGKISFKSAGFMIDPFCSYHIRSVLLGVKITIYLGVSGGFANLDRFRAEYPFEVYIFKPEPIMSTVDISAAIHSPFSVFGSPAHHRDIECIQRVFENWKSWIETLEPFKIIENPILITSEQCQFTFPAAFVPILGIATRNLALRFSMPPFQVIDRGQLKSRYSDKCSVKLSEENVVPTLRPFLQLAALWSISDELEVRAFARKVGSSNVKKFVSVFRSHISEIEDFCNMRKKGESFSDEVVVFQLAFHAFALLEPIKKS